MPLHDLRQGDSKTRADDSTWDQMLMLHACSNPLRHKNGRGVDVVVWQSPTRSGSV